MQANCIECHRTDGVGPFPLAGQDRLMGTADDLGNLLAAWGPCSGCPADINRDGLVSGVDLSAVLGAWGDCP